MFNNMLLCISRGSLPKEEELLSKEHLVKLKRCILSSHVSILSTLNQETVNKIFPFGMLRKRFNIHALEFAMGHYESKLTVENYCSIL